MGSMTTGKTVSSPLRSFWSGMRPAPLAHLNAQRRPTAASARALQGGFGGLVGLGAGDDSGGHAVSSAPAAAALSAFATALGPASS